MTALPLSAAAVQVTIDWVRTGALEVPLSPAQGAAAAAAKAAREAAVEADRAAVEAARRAAAEEADRCGTPPTPHTMRLVLPTPVLRVCAVADANADFAGRHKRWRRSKR